MTISGKWKQNELNPLDFQEARNGDHALCTFECDVYIFRKLRNTNPKKNLSKNRFLMVIIRLMKLDAFWTRAQSTVKQNTRRI